MGLSSLACIAVKVELTAMDLVALSITRIFFCRKWTVDGCLQNKWLDFYLIFDRKIKGTLSINTFFARSFTQSLKMAKIQLVQWRLFTRLGWIGMRVDVNVPREWRLHSLWSFLFCGIFCMLDGKKTLIPCDCSLLKMFSVFLTYFPEEHSTSWWCRNKLEFWAQILLAIENFSKSFLQILSQWIFQGIGLIVLCFRCLLFQNTLARIYLLCGFFFSPEQMIVQF